MSTRNKWGTAVITGIGPTYADRLARHGYDLILVARSKPTLDQLAASLAAQTGLLRWHLSEFPARWLAQHIELQHSAIVSHRGNPRIWRGCMHRSRRSRQARDARADPDRRS